MPRRATQARRERTPLAGDYDVLICGASFAGLAVARELAGSGARRWSLDRYEIGERQTSACAPHRVAARRWASRAPRARRSTTLVVHTPHGTVRYQLPWTFSTFDYRELCELLGEQSDAEFETAKVEGPRPATAMRPHRPRRPLRAADRRRARLAPDPRRAATATSRPTRRSRAGSRCTRTATATTSRSGSTAATSPPATAGASPPRDELRIGVGSFDPRFHVKDTTVLLAEDLDRDAVRYQGNWIPHKLRRATEGGVFFAGDSAGHCLPLTAEGIRTALYFGIALRARAARAWSRAARRATRRCAATPRSTTRTSGSSAGCCAPRGSSRGSRRACCAGR